MRPEQRIALEILRDDFVEETGRLMRRVEPDTSLAHLADRLAGHCETFDGILEPTAAELVAWTAPGDDEAVEEALRIAVERKRRLRDRLGLPEHSRGKRWDKLHGPLTLDEQRDWLKLHRRLTGFLPEQLEQRKAAA